MWARFLRGIILKVIYPILQFISAFFKSRREPFQRFIIGLNNKMILKEGGKAERILVLLPHCLQIDECKIRITQDINNCKRCGKCEIKDLIGIAEERSLNLHVATGGTIARKLAYDIRPHAIVAVACERDLSSGIADAYPMRAYGIANERPFGPCYNTRVDLDKVRNAITALTS